MSSTGNSPIYDAARSKIANSTIGFLTFTMQQGSMVPASSGSGILVRLSGHEGILTAAHVIEVIEQVNNFGVLRFPINPKQHQQMTIASNVCKFTKIGGQISGPNGPDIGFVGLPSIEVGNIKALGGVFLDLDSRKAALLAQAVPAGTESFDCIAGTVEQWTGPLVQVGQSHRQIPFEGVVEIGTATPLPCHAGHDLFQFKYSPTSGYSPPSSYGGVSGGGLWRIFYDPAHPVEITHFWPLGIAFYETPSASNQIDITCHGPISIFSQLGPIL